MDFLKELIEINNEQFLNEFVKKYISEKEEDYQEKRFDFIQKYNKKNNRLFTLCKRYKIDEYHKKLQNTRLNI